MRQAQLSSSSSQHPTMPGLYLQVLQGTPYTRSLKKVVASISKKWEKIHLKIVNITKSLPDS
jgi:hypothetical protein